MNKRIKVYFSASSKDDQNYAGYRNIVNSIEKAGGKIIFNWVNDKKKLSPQEIFKEATKAIINADVLVAEISIPSTGVGQQIAFSINSKIPVIALVGQEAKKPSRFTLGTQSDLLIIRKYDISNLTQILKDNFGSLQTQKPTKFNFIATKEINSFLDVESKKLNLSKSQFLRRIIEEKILNTSHQS